MFLCIIFPELESCLYTSRLFLQFQVYSFLVWSQLWLDRRIVQAETPVLNRHVS
jgi:hypothetical protein